MMELRGFLGLLEIYFQLPPKGTQYIYSISRDPFHGVNLFSVEKLICGPGISAYLPRVFSPSAIMPILSISVSHALFLTIMNFGVNYSDQIGTPDRWRVTRSLKSSIYAVILKQVFV